MRTAAELDAGELDATAKRLILLPYRRLRRGICDPLLGRLGAAGAGQAPARARRSRATPGGFATPGGARRRARASIARGHRA